jgi:hypothetical protein
VARPAATYAAQRLLSSALRSTVRVQARAAPSPSPAFPPGTQSAAGLCCAAWSEHARVGSAPASLAQATSKRPRASSAAEYLLGVGRTSCAKHCKSYPSDRWLAHVAKNQQGSFRLSVQSPTPRRLRLPCIAVVASSKCHISRHFEVLSSGQPVPPAGSQTAPLGSTHVSGGYVASFATPQRADG